MVNDSPNDLYVWSKLHRQELTDQVLYTKVPKSTKLQVQAERHIQAYQQK